MSSLESFDLVLSLPVLGRTGAIGRREGTITEHIRTQWHEQGTGCVFGVAGAAATQKGRNLCFVGGSIF